MIQTGQQSLTKKKRQVIDLAIHEQSLAPDYNRDTNYKDRSILTAINDSTVEESKYEDPSFNGEEDAHSLMTWWYSKCELKLTGRQKQELTSLVSNRKVETYF